jgi:hypothetical protein
MIANRSAVSVPIRFQRDRTTTIPIKKQELIIIAHMISSAEFKTLIQTCAIQGDLYCWYDYTIRSLFVLGWMADSQVEIFTPSKSRISLTSHTYAPPPMFIKWLAILYVLYWG